MHNPTYPSTSSAPAVPVSAGGWAMACALLMVVGCSDSQVSLGIAEIERGRIREQLVEVSLGEFSVPIPVGEPVSQGVVRQKNLLLLRFSLWALVAPDDTARVERLMKRNAGAIRDRVIVTCRSAPLDDVQDPNMAALRSRLLDQLLPLFEGNLLRRVFVTDTLTDPL